MCAENFSSFRLMSSTHLDFLARKLEAVRALEKSLTIY